MPVTPASKPDLMEAALGRSYARKCHLPIIPAISRRVCLSSHLFYFSFPPSLSFFVSLFFFPSLRERAFDPPFDENRVFEFSPWLRGCG